MKKYVIGWTHFDNEKIEGAECTHSDNAAIIDDIRAHGYSFSGYAHQELDGGVPVMNDGKARRFSRRIWGSTMANAHGKRHPYDYTLWAEALESEEAELRGMPSADRRISDAPPQASPKRCTRPTALRPTSARFSLRLSTTNTTVITQVSFAISISVTR